MIRYATQKDENAIYELLCELEGMSLDKEGFHEAYRDYMKDDKMHCLVAEMDKEVVGVLNLRIGTMLCRCGKIGGNRRAGSEKRHALPGDWPWAFSGGVPHCPGSRLRPF